MVQAKAWADALGESKPDAALLRTEIARLRKKAILPLEHVSKLHDWLEGEKKGKAVMPDCRRV